MNARGAIVRRQGDAEDRMGRMRSATGSTRRPRSAVRRSLGPLPIGLGLALLLGPWAAQAADPPLRAAVRREAVADRLAAAGVPREPLRRALDAHACARARGLVEGDTLTLIDYSQRSVRKRLWVLDVARGRVRFHELVAHGRETGGDRAEHFSNVEGSRRSSLGLFRTAETYEGRHGYSLRLDGLEAGVNDRARERAIVIHGADYATAEFAAQHGRLGRSWGCPAVDVAVHRALIDEIRGGTALFAWYPDASWLRESDYLDCDAEQITSSR
ncbi:MAG: murein L,D-transpeptidase catalytic domain family protein [Myxococcota bacterium]